MKAPRNLDTGDPLYLLAQLNFSQLPQLRGFPAQGLLQFFIDGEDTLYGADYDNPQSQRSWRVRYLPNVPVTALHANRVVKPAWHDDTVLPFNDPDTERRLVAQAGKQTITPTDYRFEDGCKAASARSTSTTTASSANMRRRFATRSPHC